VGRELQRAYGQEPQVVLTTPILEGLDGVQKMSKSLGNAIGIHEPPLEMYGKIMSVSDEIMWRYYELLTDVSMTEIEKMKRESHPMQAKKDLARHIVADFHSADTATKAGEDWAKQFQKDEVPEDAEHVTVPWQTVIGANTRTEIEDLAANVTIFFVPDRDQVIGSPPEQSRKLIKLDKLLAHTGLAESASDGQRKIKQKAVHINGRVVTGMTAVVLMSASDMIVRVGRRVKKVSLTM